MSDYAGTRDELATALEAGGVAVGGPAVPFVLIFGDGITDPRGLGRGQTPARFRIALFAGRPDAAASADALAALIAATLTVIRALAGWAFLELRGDRRRILGTSDYLSADVIVSAMVDIT